MDVEVESVTVSTAILGLSVAALCAALALKIKFLTQTPLLKSKSSLHFSCFRTVKHRFAVLK